MPTTVTGQNVVNLRGIEASTLFLDPIFMDDAVQNIFRVMPNVVHKQKMLFATGLDDFLRQKTGCGFKPVGNMSIYERCIETTLVEGNTEQCFDEYFQTSLMELWSKGVNMTNLQGTDLASIWQQRAQLGVQRQINKLAFFGSKASTDPTVNIVDGLWTEYIPQLVGQNLVPRVNSNSGTALAAGEAIELLDAVFESATNELKAFDMNRRRMFVSNNIFEQLTKDLRDGATGSAAYIQETEGGRTMIRFRGVQVVPMLRWQELAQQYMAALVPGIGENANLVLYTIPENLVLATDVLASINQFRFWYEELEEKTYMKSCFKLGFNYLHPSLMTVAY
jgi:hypothetical protein